MMPPHLPLREYRRSLLSLSLSLVLFVCPAYAEPDACPGSFSTLWRRGPSDPAT